MNPVQPSTTSALPRGLSELSHVALAPDQEAMLAEVADRCGADGGLRRRLLAQARDLLALETLTRGHRFTVQGVSADAGGLRAVVEMKVPVPTRPGGPGTPLKLEPAAELFVVYPARALVTALPGTSFVAIFRPAWVWHANVQKPTRETARMPQILCLGARLFASIKLGEILVLTYQALAMQGSAVLAGFSARNPAGLLNPEAAADWQRLSPTLPLTREPFVPVLA